MHTLSHRSDPVATAQRLISSPLRRLAALVARGWAAWCDALSARRQQRALRQLDDSTLRDLGLARCEISSLAAELRGHAEATRVWALRAERRPA
jgi:uncharacterized protein YjiS (DUF1127 family)